MGNVSIEMLEMLRLTVTLTGPYTNLVNMTIHKYKYKVEGTGILK